MCDTVDVNKLYDILARNFGKSKLSGWIFVFVTIKIVSYIFK